MARTTTFGARLRTLRQRAGIDTPEELAERSGLHPMAIRKIEDGQRAYPRLDTVLALARGLGIGPGELLEGVG